MQTKFYSLTKWNVLLIFVTVIISNSCMKRDVVPCDCVSHDVKSDEKENHIEQINKLLRKSNPSYRIYQEEGSLYSVQFSETDKYSFYPNVIDLKKIEIIGKHNTREVLLELQTFENTKDIIVVFKSAVFKQWYFSITINSYADAQEIARHLCELLCNYK